MQPQPPCRRPKTRKLATFGFWLTSLMVVHLLDAVPAQGFEHTWPSSTPGVVPGLLFALLVAALASSLFVCIDHMRSNSLTKRHRRLIVIAIFAVFTMARLIHYGIIVDADDWSLLEQPLPKFQSGPAPVDGKVTFD